MINLTSNNNIIIPSQIQFENQFEVLEFPESPLVEHLKENPIDLYVVSISAVCRNCPLRKTRLGCTQCSRLC